MINDSGNEVERISLTCCKCKEVVGFWVESEDLQAWKDGELIQNALGYLTADEREILISTRSSKPVCGKCFDGFWHR